MSYQDSESSTLISIDGGDDDGLSPPRKSKRGRGRPKKVIRGSPKESKPRKKKDLTKVSKQTIRRRGRSAARKYEYSVEILEAAVRVAKRKNNITITKEKLITPKPVVKHSAASAVALYLDLDMSKRKYTILAQDCRARNAPILPSYPIIRQEMKNREVPPSYVSEREIRTEMQSMLNITGEQITEAVAPEWPEQHLERVEFTVTIGSDASSNHTNPQIGWKRKEDEIRDPQLTIVMTMMLIVCLKSITGDSSWVNPTPQSYRFCRPLRMYVGKETTENIQEEHERLKSEISKLEDHSFNLSNGKKVTLHYNVFNTMYDGKCVNAMTGNKCSSNCPICHCTQKQAANVNGDFTPIPENLKFGLGLLHVNIRTTENFLQLAYKSPIRNWSVRGDENKVIVSDHKGDIQDDVYDAFKIRVDQILQGTGTTNTGNLARKLFGDPKKFAKVLGIDESIVVRVSLAMKLFRCQKMLKLDKVQELCDGIYKDYFDLYEWALMSPTLHKFLKHACEIAAELPMSVAYFAEDAVESCHKETRKTNRDHTRHNDREAWITDLWNRSVIKSDPYISLLSLKRRHKSEDIIITRSMVPYIQDDELEGVEIFEDDKILDESNDDDELEKMDCFI